MSHLRHDHSFAAAMAAAVRFLALRWRTSGEVRRYLLRRGYPEPIVQQVVERCRERKFIDDRAYAEQFIRQRVAKGYGPQRIAQELTDKGLTPDVYRALLDGVEHRELLQAAQRAAVKKANQLSPNLSAVEKKAKIARHLHYKGFSQTVIHRVLETLFSSGP